MSDGNKDYLGDGVYADFDGYQLRLYLDDGTGEHNEIYLEPCVLAALDGYRERVMRKPKPEEARSIPPEGYVQG